MLARGPDMTASRRPRVLVTGATGYIASQLLPTFRERYDLVLLDVRNTDRSGNKVDGVTIGSMLDGPDDEIRPLFTGTDAVVHLAYHYGSQTTARAGAAVTTRMSARTSTWRIGCIGWRYRRASDAW